MKSRVFFLGFLSLLCISKVEASAEVSVDFMSDIPAETVDGLKALHMHRAFTETATINDQLALLKAIPKYFNEKAKELIPSKEAPAHHPSPKKEVDLTEEDGD